MFHEFIRTPKRVAVIPDGQRRYALQKGIPLEESYRQGAERVEEIIDWTQKSVKHGVIGTELIAFWGGSVENLVKRPEQECAILHNIYDTFLERLTQQMDEPDRRDVRFVHMGETQHLRETTHALIREITGHTKRRMGLIVALCLDYGSEQDLEQAARTYSYMRWLNLLVGRKVKQADYLYLARQGIAPAPFDYVIRTGTAKNKPYLSRFGEGYGVLQEQYHPEYFPEYSVQQFDHDVTCDFPMRRQTKGG